MVSSERNRTGGFIVSTLKQHEGGGQLGTHKNTRREHAQRYAVPRNTAAERLVSDASPSFMRVPAFAVLLVLWIVSRCSCVNSLKNYSTHQGTNKWEGNLHTTPSPWYLGSVLEMCRVCFFVAYSSVPFFFSFSFHAAFVCATRENIEDIRISFFGSHLLFTGSEGRGEEYDAMIIVGHL